MCRGFFAILAFHEKALTCAYDMEDDWEALPEPTTISEVKANSEADIVTLVDVDFEEYRRKNDMRTVKKNCTIPSWLNFEADKGKAGRSQMPFRYDIGFRTRLFLFLLLSTR